MPGIHAELLRQIAKPPAMTHRVGENRRTVERDRALVGLLQCRQRAHQRRLAGAVGSEQSEQAAVDIEGDAAHGVHAVFIGLGDAGDGEHEAAWRGLDDEVRRALDFLRTEGRTHSFSLTPVS